MKQPPRVATMPRFCLFAMLAMLLAACSFEEAIFDSVEVQGSFAVAPPPTTLTLWHTVTPQQADTLQVIADRWARQQTMPVQVSLQSISGAESMHQTLLAAIQTQQQPDLAFVRPSDLPQYAEADALVSLNSYWDSQSAGTQADFMETVLNSTQCPVQEKTALLAMPTHRHQTVLYVNKTRLMEELQIESMPTTWDALLADCEAHSALSRNACLSLLPTGEMATLYFLNHNNPVVDPVSHETALAEGSALAALQRLNDLQTRRLMQMTLSRDGSVLDFTGGRTLFSIEPTDQLDEYAAAIGDRFEWEVLPLPAEGSPPRTLVSGGNLAIFHTTPERESLALSFLTYLTEPDVNARWAEVMEAFPVRHSALEKLTAKSNDPHFQQAAALLPTAHSLPCIRQWHAIEAQLTQLVTDTLNNVAPPETLLATAAQTANNLLR